MSEIAASEKVLIVVVMQPLMGRNGPRLAEEIAPIHRSFSVHPTCRHHFFPFGLCPYVIVDYWVVFRSDGTV